MSKERMEGAIARGVGSVDLGKKSGARAATWADDEGKKHRDSWTSSDIYINFLHRLSFQYRMEALTQEEKSADNCTCILAHAMTRYVGRFHKQYGLHWTPGKSLCDTRRHCSKVRKNLHHLQQQGSLHARRPLTSFFGLLDSIQMQNDSIF